MPSPHSHATSHLPPCVVFENADFLVARKPAGWATHESSPFFFGFAEYLSSFYQAPLKVIHRLDVGTSGLLVLARHSEAAAQLSDLFLHRKIQKTYYLISDRESSSTKWTVENHLERGDDKITRSNNQKEINARTHFEKKEEIRFRGKNYFLYEARPETGRPHQIRAHAKDSRIPLLGDAPYGGSPHSRLALFASALEWTNEQKEHFSFQDPEFEPKLSKLLSHMDDFFGAALKTREQLLPEKFYQNPKTAFRWIHKETPDFEVDVYGENLWIYLRNADVFADVQNEIPHVLSLSQRSIQNIFLMKMTNRGQGGLVKELFVYKEGKFSLTNLNENMSVGTTWTIEENHLLFLLKTNAGFSPGLFLDQRENRKWVKEKSQGKKVLNLFSYTGGFSVCAAAGGAQEICTVDVSSVFHQWCKENFELNHLSWEKQEFWTQDSLLFLKGCKKRQRTFDLIVCDPPSLGRSKDRVFKIEKDWIELFHLCLDALSPQGTLLFSNNYENWSQEEWLRKVQKELQSRKGFSLEAGRRCADYEAFQLQPAMKSFFISRFSV